MRNLLKLLCITSMMLFSYTISLAQCNGPTNLQIQNLVANGNSFDVTFMWVEQDNTESYYIEYDIDGAITQTAAIASSPLSIFDLPTTGDIYEFTVYGNCTDGTETEGATMFLDASDPTSDFNSCGIPTRIGIDMPNASTFVLNWSPVQSQPPVLGYGIVYSNESGSVVIEEFTDQSSIEIQGIDEQSCIQHLEVFTVCDTTARSLNFLNSPSSGYIITTIDDVKRAADCCLPDFWDKHFQSYEITCNTDDHGIVTEQEPTPHGYYGANKLQFREEHEVTICEIESACLHFDGTDDYVETPNSVMSTVGNGDFTFEAWISGEEAMQNMHPVIFSNRDSPMTTTKGCMFFLHAGTTGFKQLAIQLGGVNYLANNNGTFGASVLDDVCHHVAITKSGDLLEFYIDGSLVDTKVLTVGVSTVSQIPLWIGQDAPTNNTFNGTVSEVRIWNIVRLATEIQTYKDSVLVGNEMGLMANWELTEGAGQIVIDKTTNAFDGQLGNSNVLDIQDPTWGECCDMGVGINAIDLLSQNIVIAPNPMTDRLTVQIDMGENKVLNFVLYDIYGRTIQENTIASNMPKMIDVQALAIGMYFIAIYDEGELVGRTKVLKQ